MLSVKCIVLIFFFQESNDTGADTGASVAVNVDPDANPSRDDQARYLCLATYRVCYTFDPINDLYFAYAE